MPDYLIYRTLPQCKMVQVEADYKFTYKGHIYKIPKGFVFDGFSNPRLFWRILPSSYGPRVLEPGCKHDFFYRTHDIPKDEADRLLEKDVIDNGLNKAAARCVYWGVKFGGRRAWRNGPSKPLIGLWGKAADDMACRIVSDENH